MLFRSLTLTRLKLQTVALPDGDSGRAVEENSPARVLATINRQFAVSSRMERHSPTELRTSVSTIRTAISGGVPPRRRFEARSISCMGCAALPTIVKLEIAFAFSFHPHPHPSKIGFNPPIPRLCSNAVQRDAMSGPPSPNSGMWERRGMVSRRRK